MSRNLADDIAIDWISNKLYWTDNGPVDRIGVLDTKLGYYMSLIYTGQDTSPRAIVVDAINRYIVIIYSHAWLLYDIESDYSCFLLNYPLNQFE